MRLILFLQLFLLSSFVSWSQVEVDESDTVWVEEVRDDFTFYKGGKEISKSYYKESIMGNLEAYKHFTKAENAIILSSVLSFGGGFSVGWYLGGLLFGGEPSWIIGAAGLTAIIISVPISKSVKTKYLRSAKTYNKDLLDRASYWRGTELNLALNSNGIGLYLRF